jgi:hypothetical protein
LPSISFTDRSLIGFIVVDDDNDDDVDYDVDYDYDDDEDEC